MAKQTKYNWKGSPRGSRMSYNAEVEFLKDQPTAKQKRFAALLRNKLIEKGIDPWEGQSVRLLNRYAYSVEIERLMHLCKEAGVEINGNGKTFERVATVSGDGFAGADKVTEKLVEV